MGIKHDLLAFYGLKWNPFLPDVPVEATHLLSHIDSFFFRVEHLVIDGGFALICGDPGTGKSVALRQLCARLSKIREIKVASYTRPQNNVGDFYRELGQHFGIEMSCSNRYHGFRSLREKWVAHIDTVLFKPVLLIDEAQEVPTPVLSEIRLLTSMDFDSRNLLAVVLAGDRRLTERFRAPDLVPLGSRIKARLNLEPLSQESLKEMMQTCLEAAGAPHLLTDGLIETLAEQSMGNLRTMMTMADELLSEALNRKQNRIDEQLFLNHYQAASMRNDRKRSRK